MTSDVQRVLVAPTAFKGTIGPVEAASAMAVGVARTWPQAEIALRPLSDGGNGLLDACRYLEGGRVTEMSVADPLGGSARAQLLHQGRSVIVESAQACGLHLVPQPQREPLITSTRGVGELVAAAGATGADRVVVGLGGSGTVDGGTGMARALGWRFLDADGGALPEGGGSLERLFRVEPPPHRLPVRVTALCDVQNPLLGPQGAARIYAPQKGASAEDVERLESGLRRLAEVLESQLGLAVSELAGAGAAGGLGAGVRAFLDGELVSGAAWMIERAGLREEVARCEVVVTGEGSFDTQSEMGKVTGRVLELARSAGTPVLLACGRIEGTLPEGVRGLDGSGRELTQDDLAELVAVGCRGLATGDRL